jgi:hypothetical protein
METDFKQGAIIDNYSFLPKFTVHVYDEYGNHVNNEEEYHIQLSLANPIEFLLQDGMAEIDLEQKESRIECNFEGKIQFQRQIAKQYSRFECH